MARARRGQDLQASTKGTCRGREPRCQANLRNQAGDSRPAPLDRENRRHRRRCTTDRVQPAAFRRDEHGDGSRAERGVPRGGRGHWHIFRIITAVWGVGFLLEAALRVAIVYNTSTGTALSLSKVMPYIWVGIFMAWTVAYGRYQGNKGQRVMAAAAAVKGPGTSDAGPQPADITKGADQA